MERPPQHILNELTVATLKQITQRIGHSTSGTKVELVRILSADESAWRGAFEHFTGSSSMQRLLSSDLNAHTSMQQVRLSEEGTSRSEEVVENLDRLTIPPELMARKLEILRREKALLERELSLVRREAGMSPSIGSGTGDRAIDSGFNVRTISDMVSEFRGDSDNFDTWRRKLNFCA